MVIGRWRSVILPILLRLDIFKHQIFDPIQLDSTALSNYNNLKAYSYYIPGWLQLLCPHKSSGSNYYTFDGGHNELHTQTKIM